MFFQRPLSACLPASFLCIVSTEFCFDRCGQSVSKRSYLGFIFSFNHHSRQRLGARVSQQQSSSITQFSFNLASQPANLWIFVERPLLTHSNIHQHLWIALKTLSQFRERLLLVAHGPQQR